MICDFRFTIFDFLLTLYAKQNLYPLILRQAQDKSTPTLANLKRLAKISGLHFIATLPSYILRSLAG